MRQFLLVAAVLVVAGLVFLHFSRVPPAPPADSEAARLLLPGPHQVGVREFTLEDSTRPTQANGDFKGYATRRLLVKVWYPTGADGILAAGGPYPLVVHSHGFGSYRDEGSYLAEHLASLGYVVMAPEFPLTKMTAPGSPLVKDVVNQPADVRFLIDTALAWSADTAHPLHGAVDAGHIGAMGISLGGLTTELAFFHPRWRDERIQAAISIAGPSMMFNDRFFAANQRPFLMIAADQDALVDYQQNAAPLLNSVPHGALLTLAKGSHTGFATAAKWMRWMRNPDALGCYIVKRNLRKGEGEAPWYDLFGTPEEGIVYDAQNKLCVQDPLPASANPLQQQRVTLLAVTSFFQGQFARDAAERLRYQQYLEQGLAREFPEANYQRSAR